MRYVNKQYGNLGGDLFRVAYVVVKMFLRRYSFLSAYNTEVFKGLSQWTFGKFLAVQTCMDN
jgi:hypothetical protein